MSRIVLKSSNTAVVLGESPAFKTTDDSGSLFASVKSASFGFSSDRQKVQELGGKNLIVDDLIRSPNVDLSLSYTYSPTYANEDLMGLSFSLDEKSELSLMSSLKDKSYNFYFYNNPEQGEDGIQNIKDQNYPPGGEIISFGNAYLSSYGLNFEVGSIPEVSVSFLCSNVESEKYFGSNTKSPAINLQSGNNSGVGNFDITKTKIVEDKFFGDVYDLDRSRLATPTPAELDFTLQDLQIGGQKLSPNNHILNSFSFNMNIDRASYYKLGSDYVCGREIKYPVNATISLSSLVNGYENGFISGLVTGEEVNFLDIVATDCSGIITSKLFFENLKVEKVDYNMLVNESMNYSLELSLQINDEEGFKSYVTEEDWKATRVYDSGDSIIDFTFDDIPADYWSNRDDIYKVRFADFSSYEVGDRAFYDCDNISGKVFVPRNVNYIGESAFESCDNLSQLFFDSDHSIQQIGASGFKDCVSLSNDNLLLPTSLITINESCFEGCINLKGLSLNNVSTIGDKAFFNCSGLEGPLFFKEGTTYIGDSSFENCVSINGSIEFPDSIDYINQKAFKNCSSFKYDLVINDSISGLGAQAFYGCSGFDGVLTLSDNLSFIESGTFFNCISITGDLVIPNGVTGVGDYAFYNLGVDSLDLPEGLLYIGNGAFERLNDIKTDLFLPQSISGIGDRAFADCDSFSEYLTIPSGIQSIGEHAFSGCVGITDVYINSPTSVFQGDNAFYGIDGCLFVTPIYYNSYVSQLVDGKYQGMPVCLGSKETIVFDTQTFEIIKRKRGNIPAYWYANQSQSSLLVIGDTCRKIADNAFVDSSGLEGGLAISSGVNYIGKNAFRNCSFSGDLILSDQITGIGSGAFEGCSNLDGNLQIPYYLDILYGNTFKDCSGLASSLVLPPRVTRIEDSVFENCSSLNGFVALPAQCEYIGFKSFAECSSLSGGLIFPETLTGIGPAAFKNCRSLDGELEFNDILEEIGDSGFYNCSSLSGSLELPTDLFYLGEYAFYGCSGFEGTLFLPNELTGIFTSTFENCVGFDGDLDLPKSLSGVGDRSFYNCIGLSGAIYITDIAAQNIGTDAFFGTDFAALIVHDNVVDISSGEFDYFKTQPMSLILQNGLISVSDNAFKNYAFSGDFFLPITVGNIGNSAFQNVSFNGEYDFSQANVTGIGNAAFKNCSGISGELYFTDSLINIGDEAFRNNTSVNGELRLPQELTGIGEYAFAGNASMVGDINIPDTVSGVGQYAFLNCSSMDGYLKLSSNPFLTKVATGTFKNCGSITGDLTIPDNITNIEFQAFKNCPGLSGTVTLTDTAALSLIGKDALDESDFEHLVVSDSVQEISDGEFDYFQNADLSLTLPSNLTGILNNSFDNYQITGNLVFPSGLLTIGDEAFKFCVGLNSGLLFPESVNSIGDSAFEGCVGFSGDLTLPIGLPSIGARSFYNCIGLDGILTISDLTASSVTLLDDTFFGTNFYLLRAESLDGTISDTEFDVLASNFQGSLDIGQSVSLVGSDAFDDYAFLGSFNSSGSLSEISDRAFSGVQFSGNYAPEFVVEIGNDAFRNCGFDGTASFFDSTEVIGNRAFMNCDQLKGDLKLTSSVASIGNQAFFDCTGFDGEFVLSADEGEIENPEFDTELVSIGSYAFVGVTGVSGNLIIPGSVTSIGEHAFEGMQTLNGYLYIGSGLTEIKEATFKDCNGLSAYNDELSIPRPVTNIRVDAFNGCSSLSGSLLMTKEAAISIETNAFLNTNFDNLTVLSGASFIEDGDFDYFQSTGVSLTLNSDLIDIRSGSFDDFNFVGNLTIPSDVTGIGAEAFARNNGFQGGLTIPFETLAIGDFAFSGCSGFSSLSFQNYEFSRLNDIGSGAFKNCDGFSNELFLPSPLENIQSGAFQGCSGFQGRLIIPDNLDSIGEHAFSGCTGISGVFIDTLGPEVFTVQQGDAFLGCRGYLELGVLVYSDYAVLSTPVGDDLYFQGMPISGVGASESVFYTGAVGDYNILNRAIQDAIDVVVEGQSYVIPDNWKDTTARTAAGIAYNQPLWFSLGALCEEIGANAFNSASYLQGTLNLGGDLRIIGEYAFVNCGTQGPGLTGLTLGSSLEVVKTGAFQSCSKIRSSLVFQSNVTGIETNAFYNNDIVGVTFLDGIQEIGDRAFQYCYEIAGDIDFPTTLNTVGTNAFQYDSKIENISFSNPNTNIGQGAFQSCSSLQSITLPTNITFLGNSAFDDCTSAVGNLTIPSSLESVSYQAFEDCPKIGSLTLNGQSRFEGYCFRRCYDLNKDTDGSLEIPEEVVLNDGYLRVGAFNNCRSITSVTFPDNFSGTHQWLAANESVGIFSDCISLEKVTYGIGLDVVSKFKFYECNSLSGVSNPDWLSLTGIEQYSFYRTDLRTIYIPENVTEIGDYAFAMSAAIGDFNITQDLTIDASGNLKKIGDYAFRGRAISQTFLPENLPAASGFSLGIGAYQNCEFISPTISIPECVSGMGTNVFNGCSLALNYTWPSTLTTIPDSTFRNCSNLEAFVIPSWVDTIEANAFRNCPLAEGSINIHSDVVYVGAAAFQGSTEIGQVLFNNTNQIDILANTFLDCTSLSGTLVLSNVRDIYSKPFNNTNIDFIQWNDVAGPNVIQTQAFEDNTSITGISLPSGLSYVGARSFQRASSLKEIDLSDTNVSAIGNNVFIQATSMSGVDLDNGELLSIGYQCFRQSFIESIEIPDPVSTIGFSCFDRCTNLKEVNFSTNQLTTFESNLFQSAFYPGANSIIMPTNLDTVKVSCFQTSNISGVVDFSDTNLSTIQYQAFYSCPLLEAVKFPATLGFIARDMFELSNNLVWVSGDGITELENDVFKDCPNFSGFMGAPSGLPPSLEVIGNDNFVRCGNIKPRQNYLISGNIESIGNFNWYQQTSTQSLIIHDSFSGSIGNSNWRDVGNMGELSILFDNADGTIGSENWKDCNLMTDVYINCPYSAWVGTNNFNNASTNLNIRIKNTHFNDYTVANNWSGEQGVNPQATISSYVP